jgi:predicted PurR-regulated permease PerM
LSGPVQDWIGKAPASIVTAKAKLSRLRGPMDRIAQAASGDSTAATDSTAAPRHQAPPRPAAQPMPATPAAPVPPILTRALGTTVLILGAFAEMILLLYLLLSSGDLFLRKLMKFLPAREDKRSATEVLLFAQSVVARYLVLTLAIAAGQGAAVGLAMWALGMPDPIIWGLLTTLAELIPYLGGAVMVGLLSLSALTVFDSIGHAILVPVVYLTISAIQNNAVTPLLFGKRLKLNSVAVLIGVVFWWFLWGVPGAFMAIPILAMAKVLSDQIPRLAMLGEFLGE